MRLGDLTNSALALPELGIENVHVVVGQWRWWTEGGVGLVRLKCQPVQALFTYNFMSDPLGLLERRRALVLVSMLAEP